MLLKRVPQHKLLVRNLSVRKEKQIMKTKRRKSSHIFTGRTRDKKKRKVGDVNGVEEVCLVDQISEFPEHILHHILSLLRCPKDATRTSVLSKKWRSIWTSFLTFDFDQKSFQAQGGEQKEQFKNFVENSLSTRLEPMFCIQKFRLYLTSFDFKLARHMNRWIGAATNKNVRELEIHVEVKKKRRYILPHTVFTAKTITSLKLHGCMIYNCADIKLSNLQELSIKKAHVDVDVIQCFIGSCPLIEDLRLVSCSGLECLRISTLLKLSRVEVHECHGLKLVEIKLSNLQSFWFHGKRSNGQCKINLAGCENLKYLTLKDTYMTDELFQDRMSKFPVLEKLVLKECNVLERITILSGTLKGLALVRCKKLEEANVDAPNLFSFEYTGDKMPFSSMNISGLHETKLHFESIRKTQVQFALEVQKFLGKFDQSKGLKLIMCSNKNVTIHEELREIKFPPFNDLKLELTKSSTGFKDLVDSWLRTSHPKTLSIVSPSSEFLKFIVDKITNREENPNCCRYYSRKCWLHYLEDVETEIFEVAENKETSACCPNLMSSSTLHKITFKLKWRSIAGARHEHRMNYP